VFDHLRFGQAGPGHDKKVIVVCGVALVIRCYRSVLPFLDSKVTEERMV
jgi:hypothetical protein